MFDFTYNENVGFVPYVSVLKAQAEKTQEEIDELSSTVSEQGEAVSENSKAISNNAEAINENAEAIVGEGEARAAADEALEAMIAELPKFKIEVVDELPEVGDSATLYLLEVSSTEGNLYVEYVYANGAWEELGPLLDLSIYATKEEMNAAFSGVYTKEEVDELIAPFAVKDDVDAALALKADSVDVDAALALKANSADVDAALALKANTEDVNAALALKANSADMDAALALKANAEDVDTALALKANAEDVYTKDEADAKFLTEHQDISNLATKDELVAEANTRAEGVSSALSVANAAAAGLADEINAREEAIAELHEEIVALPKFKIVIVDELPASGDNATIYLVPAGSESDNIYTEYVYVNDAWEEVGPEKLDLSEYAKIVDVDAALSLKADAEDVYTKNEIDDALGAKADSADVYSKAEIDAMTPSFATKDELSAATEPLAVQADVDDALALKANAEDVYTKSDVDAALAEKTDVNDYLTLSGVVEDILFENESIEEKLIGLAEANLAQDEVIATKADKTYVDGEVYKLATIVGDLGGAVTYELPSPAGKSFNTLMLNNGTVKLTDDVESGRFGPGITARNTTKLNLNGHDLTVTGLTISSSYPAIMSRGTENLTIYGKGTIDAGGGICIEANGVDSVINLTGSTTVYRTNRSKGELIYCYAGTINITNGTFRNDGENTAFLLNCYDANYKADPKKANIIVSSTSKTNGPKFYDFNPADNSAEGEHTNFVAPGCEVVVSTVVEDGVEHTVYTVVKSAE